MRFRFCPDCGSRLTEKEIGDEGMIPFCKECDRPLFDMFSSCVIVLAVNEFNEAVLLRQSYISDKYYNLISGYMKPGETAELSAVREVYEEIGIKPESMEFAGTYWFGKKDMLMIGFICHVRKAEFRLSKEVDKAEWADINDALSLVHPRGSISYSLVKRYMDMLE